ncbi:4-hydroxythreonine-4-phosphate dehydrogenase PdxA [Pikeienuella sp. HZG-20]|uniref:4-hydroxythreonine-4-phosphate dehydrogenase PdxA n=1 Tax=Paludibacillus litoralis TaxID=3133267 RepID=UPI0030EB7DC9
MRPLAVTMGDPAGIGGEVLVKAWRAGALDGAAFFAIDDPARLRALGADVAEIGAPEDVGALPRGALPVLPEPLSAPPRPGAPAPENAGAVVRSIERAARLALEGRAGAVVTAPINKKALHDDAAFAYPGHTEFLAALSGAPLPVMMLTAPGLRVVPVTIHIPLSEAPKRLTRSLIEETGAILAAALTRDFGVERPRIAVAGLNPHAGEGGAMGAEDAEIIAPAIAALRAGGIDAFGPLPADTMFHEAARARYDAALCMYHDQALIPVKMLDFARGVNVTLGLPFIRTSPDHGTAYDIAGSGRADPTSMIEAMKLAATMAARRR